MTDKIDLSQFMTQIPTGGSIETPRMNIAFVDSIDNFHPDPELVRVGTPIDLIDFLDEGFVPTSEGDIESDRSLHRRSRVATYMSGKRRVDETYYVLLTGVRLEQVHGALKAMFDPAGPQQLASTLFSILDIPEKLLFLPYAIYFRVGDTTWLVRHRKLHSESIFKISSAG